MQSYKFYTKNANSAAINLQIWQKYCTFVHPFIQNMPDMKNRALFIVLLLSCCVLLQAAPTRRAHQRPAQHAVGTPNLPQRGLILLVNFSDLSFQATNTQAAFDSLFNGDNYTYSGAHGSVKQYFSDQSNGSYKPEFDVYGPFTLSQDMAYYGANNSAGEDIRAAEMVVEACHLADSLYAIDFSRYDTDNDGKVNVLHIIYAGKGEADSEIENTIWQHNWTLMTDAGISSTQLLFDGVYVDRYSCYPELTAKGQSSAYGNSSVTYGRTGIGSFCFEMSLVMGLPALYDVNYDFNYNKALTPGQWDIMDYGAYCDNGNCPPNYSVWEKAFFGWCTPVNLGNTAQSLTLYANGTSNYQAYYFNDSGSDQNITTSGVCYYIENRQQTGWDSYLPGHGLIIWRVDYNQSAWENNTVNSTKNNVRYTLVPASGQTTNIGSGADPFPGTKNVSSWSGLSDKPITNIYEANGLISCNFISATQPVEEYIEVIVPLSPKHWSFVMFPEQICGMKLNTDSFDLGNRTYWACYDGEVRALGKSGWKFYDKPKLDCSQAYIVYTNEAIQLTLKLPISANKPTDVTIPIRTNPSIAPYNDSWNFIGNPYIFGYDIRGLAAEGLTTPIAVWDGTEYVRYTPGIDSYTLQPLQPFFVQMPAQQTITFRSEYIVSQ